RGVVLRIEGGARAVVDDVPRGAAPGGDVERGSAARDLDGLGDGERVRPRGEGDALGEGAGGESELRFVGGAWREVHEAAAALALGGVVPEVQALGPGRRALLAELHGAAARARTGVRPIEA